MNIQGPTGPPPVDNEPLNVTPSTGSTAPRSPAQAHTASVQVQLSPSLFKQGQILQVVISKMEQDALLLVLQNKLTDHRGELLNVQFRVPRFPGAQPGQHLSVQVVDIKHNQPVLQLLSASKTQTDLLATLQQSLTNSKPLQGVFEHLLAAKQLPTAQLTLPTEVRDQLDRLWRTLPEASQLQRGENLRHAFKNAGPFLEAQLAKMTTGNSERLYPEMDIRTQLLRLAEALRQHAPQPANATANTTSTREGPSLQSGLATTLTSQSAQTQSQNLSATGSNARAGSATSAQDVNLPNAAARQAIQYDGLKAEQILQQLLTQTDAGLARIQQQQAQMLQPDARPQWLLELPVKHNNGVDVFDVRIQPDAQHQDNNQPDQHYPWTVMLGFNLEGLGPVRAQISLFNGTISSYWWAEQQHTVQLFHQHLSFLENRLQHAGVPFQQLACECGIPEAKATQNKTPYSNINLDEQA